MSKRFVKDQMDKAHTDYMVDASAEVEIIKDADGRWNVRCYNSRGHYIGGIGSVTDLLVARRYAETYAVIITQRGE